MKLSANSIRSWSFVGALPPPYGGVTVFAKRRVSAWRHEGAQVQVVDLTRMTWARKLTAFVCLLWQGSGTGIYVNDLSGFGLAVGQFNLRGARVFFHDHNYGLAPMRGWRAWLLKRFLERCEGVFFDGCHSRDNYITCGFLREEKSFTVVPPFIPPDVEEQQMIVASYPESLLQFLAQHTPVICGNAYKIVLDPLGRDLYGVDMAVELLRTLRRHAPRAGVVFAIAVDEQSEYSAALNKRIQDYGLTNHFYFFTGSRELWPLFGLVDVMVRPTTTDGYGISVAEALFVQTPAIASDVCQRPEGTVLFACRDQLDLDRKVLKCLELL